MPRNDELQWASEQDRHAWYRARANTGSACEITSVNDTVRLNALREIGNRLELARLRARSPTRDPEPQDGTIGYEFIDIVDAFSLNVNDGATGQVSMGEPELQRDPNNRHTDIPHLWESELPNEPMNQFIINGQKSAVRLRADSQSLLLQISTPRGTYPKYVCMIRHDWTSKGVFMRIEQRAREMVHGLALAERRRGSVIIAERKE